MTARPSNLPALYVEGTDDVSVIAALLRQNGVDTKQGTQHLWIHAIGSIRELLETMADTIKAGRDFPTGFAFDIDIELTHRWTAVRDRLNSIGIVAPGMCPQLGFFDKMPGYPHSFGVWLMPDCMTDGQKLEHLIQTLMPAGHPLWPHAKASTAAAIQFVDVANAHIADDQRKWKRFGDDARIKAEVRSWLAWQKEPGVQLGAAINDHILRHDSPQALAFLRWLRQLYGFTQLANI